MPVVYYGDEQGFTGDGGDQDARQDMDGSEVASYNDDDLIGTDRTTATPSFEPGHPLYVALQGLAALTKAHPTLRDGAQIHRLSGDAAGVYAFSRITGATGIEYVVALNNAETPQTVAIPTFSAGVAFTGLYPAGTADATTGEDRGLTVTVPPLSAAVWRATAPLAAPSAAPTVTIAAPADGAEVEGRVEVRADVTGDGFHEVTFAMQAGDGAWRVLGTDDNPPYRVHPDVADIAGGTALTFKAVVRTTPARRRPTSAPPPWRRPRRRSRRAVRTVTTWSCTTSARPPTTTAGASSCSATSTPRRRPPGLPTGPSVARTSTDASPG
jgi:hypothetical protein